MSDNRPYTVGTNWYHLLGKGFVVKMEKSRRTGTIVGVEPGGVWLDFENDCHTFFPHSDLSGATVTAADADPGEPFVG